MAEGSKTTPISIKTAIRARDYRRARRFYEEVLKLEVVDDWDVKADRGCIFGFRGQGSNEVTGFLELTPALDPGPEHEEPAPRVELQLRIASADAWTRRLDELGIAYEGPVDRPWGNRYVWVRDPEGVRIALFEGKI